MRIEIKSISLIKTLNLLYKNNNLLNKPNNMNAIYYILMILA